MRETMKTCHHAAIDDAIYKEVVIIGNGPSGMVTSYMLAGNVPYLKLPIPDDLPIDEMLRARLSHMPPGQSLYEADLMELAEGLEGRSQNPIPLLMDSLLRPGADIGIQSDSLIEWKYEADKKVDHVVLGRGPAGGAWHTFPPSVRTLSPGAWLSLPPLPARPPTARLSAAAVAAYCRRYVAHCKLQRYFLIGVVVTSVRPSPRPPRPSQPAPPAGDACSPRCPRHAKWLVTGYCVTSGAPVRYRCARAVIAAGGAGRANTLPGLLPPPSAGTPSGGAGTLGGVTHTLADVQRAVTLLQAAATADPSFKPVVLVVGSGVSAADAVCLSRSRGISVALAHRDPAPALLALSPSLYPEYHQVYKMMCEGTAGKYENYTPYPEHVILKVKPDTSLKAQSSDLEQAIQPKKVQLLNVVTNEIVEIKVNLIAVLIGSRPDLFFLQTNFNLNCIEFEPRLCPKCSDNKIAPKRKIEDDTPSFLKNHWHYLKSVLGQSIQNCKSRYLNTEINGNTDTKCIVTECNRNNQEIKCTCNNLVTKLENGSIKTEFDKECNCYPYRLKTKIKCHCRDDDPYSNGIGFGIDPSKPVDCRANPVAVDKSTHEMLNAPPGLYALGPLTADNFIRFIPGGALAVVADIQKTRKSME